MKLQMARIKNQKFGPLAGWDIWRDEYEPQLNELTYMPRKPLNMKSIRKAYAWMEKNKYMSVVEVKEAEDWMTKQEEVQAAACEVCTAFRIEQRKLGSRHTDTKEESTARKSKHDEVTKDFLEHLRSEPDSHDMPTVEDCWPLFTNEDGDEEKEQSAGDGKAEAEEKTDDELEDGEFMVDPIGKEIMSVGRAQYAKINPLVNGDYAVMDARGNPTDNERYWVAQVMGYNAVEKKVQVWWHGHSKNKNITDAAEKKWYTAKLSRSKKTKWFFVAPIKPPLPIPLSSRFTGWVHQNTIFYWNENILTDKGNVRVAQLKRVEARFDLVCTRTPRDKHGNLL
jgi:hypothetical protein